MQKLELTKKEVQAARDAAVVISRYLMRLGDRAPRLCRLTVKDGADPLALADLRKLRQELEDI